ncbi:MAG: nucleotidyltransferase family protein [Thiotrichaceae bacterium]
MKAMILAAGHGKRMRPLTDHLPKPLLEVGGKPLIVWHIKNLKQAGIKDIIINMGWKGWKLPEVLGDGSNWNIHLHYSDEQDTGPLETAGGIHHALPLLGKEPFIVVNGDIWCEYSYTNLENLDLADNDLAHLVLTKNPEHNPDGDFHLQSNRVSDSCQPCFTFSGIGCYRPELFQDLTAGKSALAPLLRTAMQESKVSGEYFSGDWRDIGTPERLEKLNNDKLNKNQ